MEAAAMAVVAAVSTHSQLPALLNQRAIKWTVIPPVSDSTHTVQRGATVAMAAEVAVLFNVTDRARYYERTR